MTTETLSVRKYTKYGYEVRTEMVCYPVGSEPIEVLRAYTSSGTYIGDPKTAEAICKKKGIVPETIDDDRNICSIGFCGAEQKWYGWSHRAICGFGSGSSVKKDDCAYVPDNTTELAETYSEWNDCVEIVDGETIRIGTVMQDVVGENEDGSLQFSDETTKEWYTVKTGRGSWTAKTIDDARQMAIDFANDVA
jgi:hypothetical protein